MGRPSTFNPEVAERVCARIAEGMSVRAACKLDDLPHWRTFLRWLATADPEQLDGEEKVVGPFDRLRQHYARARELRADARFESADHVMYLLRTKKVDAQAARVMLDAIKWQTGIENARRYGNAVTLRGDKENPVEIRRTPRDLSDEELAAIAQGGLRGTE